MSRGTNILAIGETASTSTSTTTRAREVMSFAVEIGLQPNQRMATWIETLLQQGVIEQRVLLAVLEETSFAPYPSWRYFAAIVRKLMDEVSYDETYTFKMWVDRQQSWEARKGSGLW